MRRTCRLVISTRASPSGPRCDTRCQVCAEQLCSYKACAHEVITHLGDLLVGSKVGGTCCGIVFLASNTTPLPPEESDRFNGNSRVSWKRAYDAEHSHPLQSRPAGCAKPETTKGILNELLKHACAFGKRRRMSFKTPPAIANLRFKPGV